MELKEEFITRSRELLGSDADSYFKTIEEPLNDSFRVNTLKINIEALVNRLKNKGWELRNVPWCKEGYWVLNGRAALRGKVLGAETPERIGNTLEHFLGYYYVQEAGSMIPPLMLELKEGQKVLDMAASPGSKTGQMAGIMNDEGLIIANDVRIDRVSILKVNMQRIGVRSLLITRRNAMNYQNMKGVFDRILLDAPCSGEGVIRSNPYSAVEWNVPTLRKLGKVQKGLIMSAYEALKPGSLMVYSTCSLAPEEDEEVVNLLLDKTDAILEPARINGLKTRDGITEWQGNSMDKRLKNCARIYPQDNDTEGFFVAKVRKPI